MSDWSYMQGDKRIVIKYEDIIYAIDTAKSLIAREIEFNERIKDSPQFKRDYEAKLEVLKVVQDKFKDGFHAMARGTVTKIIPSKRYHKR